MGSETAGGLRKRRRWAGLVLAASLGLGALGGLTGCPSPPANIVPAVFTIEQTVCMVDGLVSGLLTGEASVIAADILTACGIAPALTQDVINFINAFTSLSPTQQADWRTWAALHKAVPVPASSR